MLLFMEKNRTKERKKSKSKSKKEREEIRSHVIRKVLVNLRYIIYLSAPTLLLMEKKKETPYISFGSGQF